MATRAIFGAEVTINGTDAAMSARKAHGVTRQHAQALSEVIAWAGAHPETTPLELGVLEEMRDRVARHAKDAAIVRVRVKNLGGRAKVRRDGATNWTVREMADLERLWREGLRVVEIADRIGRTAVAVDGQIARMHLFGTRARPPVRFVNYRHPSSPLMRAKRVMNERRRVEAVARREA